MLPPRTEIIQFDDESTTRWTSELYLEHLLPARMIIYTSAAQRSAADGSADLLATEFHQLTLISYACHHDVVAKNRRHRGHRSCH